jgi:CHAT domain-containing protein
LAPDDESDGRLSAYELLGLDLRGLELVTLSACNTALGRFDWADNLLGLPAALLLAGTSAIVGALWPVETHASECFFVTFYRELRKRAAPLDAFAAAQKQTREQFPAYSDWGPFYFMGAWAQASHRAETAI